jgi:hypothetical protein
VLRTKETVKVKPAHYKALGFQEDEAPRFQNIRHMKVVIGKPYALAAFTPRKHSWYSFLLEAESTQGTYCGQKDYVNEKFQ